MIMLEEASKTAQVKEELKREDIKHKIETLKLKQEKIRDGIREIFDERGIKVEDHDLVRKAFEKEHEKVQHKLKITKIIHDTYEKEIERYYQRQEEEARRKREESEERKRAAIEAEKQRELAAAEEERKK